MILVKKGGKLPEGHIQSWFWERGNLKDSLALKLPAGAPPSACVGTMQWLSAFSLWPQLDILYNVRPCMLVHFVHGQRRCPADSEALSALADIASKVKVGQTEFKRYPENLLNSRVRYGRAFQVRDHQACVRCCQAGGAASEGADNKRNTGAAVPCRQLQMRRRAMCWL